VTSEELQSFMLKISLAQTNPDHDRDGGIPWIEASRGIIEHYQRDLKAFDKVKYFIFHNVKVYEEGFRDMALEQDNEDVNHRMFKNSKFEAKPMNLGTHR
jgi:hypothetical protein